MIPPENMFPVAVLVFVSIMCIVAFALKKRLRDKE